MKNYLAVAYFLLFICSGYAQLPDAVELPEHRGKRVTYLHEFAKAFLYISSDNRIYDMQGVQIKNPNEITQELKAIPADMQEVYIFADKRAKYSTVDLVKAAIARSGIDRVVYMMRLTLSFKPPVGFKQKLDIPKIVSENKETSISAQKEEHQKLSYQQITILKDQKIRLMDGKQLEISSKAYKKLIKSYDVIAVDYSPDLSYGDYIFWLDNTRKIVKKQSKKKRTIIQELLVELMKYDKGKIHEVKLERP